MSMFDDPAFDQGTADLQEPEDDGLPWVADLPHMEPEQDDKPGRRSVAAQLVDMARGAYNLGVTDTDDPYGVSRDRPHIAMMLRGGRTGLRAELARRFFTENNTVASQQALADACTVLEGLAAQEDPRRVYLRVGECSGIVYIDTGDVAGSVITIAAGTWEITQCAPVLFRRTKLTGEMAKPVQGGDLSRLWEFVPIDEADQPVLLACLASALIQVDVPHPIPALLAEHGSAKSSTTRCLVDLVDPSPVPLRQPPRDLDGWSTSASASWVVALDNLSGRMPSWLSDALCRASTGDGNVKRALYTDSDVSVTAYRRCAIINGVDLIIDRGDLADRLAPIRLPRVTTRRSEDELAAAWSAARPHIFGGLLDLAAGAHRRLPNIAVPNPPRMADFARVLAAVDAALGTTGLDRYRETSRLVAVDTLDEAFIAELVERRIDVTDVTSAELLKEVKPNRPDWKPPRDWPKNARAVTAQLTRNAPALRAQGWAINNDGGHTKDGITRWTITPSEDGPNPDPPDPPNPPSQVNDQKSGGSEHNGFPATDPLFPAGGLGGDQAGNAPTGNPPQNQALTCGDGSAGQAGQEIAPSQDSRSGTGHLCTRCERVKARTDTGMCDFCTVRTQAVERTLQGETR
jgi:hypothetical protein